MNLFRSKSFTKLVLSGLALVALPMIIVLAGSNLLLNSLAQHSSLSVAQSVSGSQLGLQLIEQITNQERRARQYQILGDKRLLDEVGIFHEQMQSTLKNLVELPSQHSHRDTINQMISLEKQMFGKMVNNNPKSEIYSKAISDFSILNQFGKNILQIITDNTSQEIEALKKEASKAKSILFWLALFLLPLTGFLISYLSRQILRPIKQIDSGIHNLGKGDFSSKITVNGPDDLVFLGKRLDWLREKLAAFEKDKNKFTSHISHELKTPLASIRESSELLADEIAGPVNNEQQEIIKILNKNSVQLQELIQNLINYTMAKAQKTNMNVSEFSLENIVNLALKTYKPIILKNKLQMIIDLEPLFIRGDEEMLKTVIDNLLSNAIKHSPLSGIIHCKISRQHSLAQIDIIDSGPGIPPDESENIFTPFFQGRNSGYSHIKGTGLGLSIAKEYVNAHEGVLDLIEDHSEGAHFRVLLPIDCTETT